MSGWKSYIDNKLLNSVDEAGHNYTNCLEGGAIIGLDGGLWACSDDFVIGKRAEQVDGKIITVDEFKNLNYGMKHNGDCTLPGGYWLNAEKFQMINFDEAEGKMYLKKSGGGAIVAKTEKAYIIGVWSASKVCKKDGKERPQNQGDASTAVEELAKFLKSQNL